MRRDAARGCQPTQREGLLQATRLLQSIPRSLLITGYYGRFFREIGLLGSGGYGSVYLTEHVLDGLALGFFAVKKTPVGDNRAWLQKVREALLSAETAPQAP